MIELETILFLIHFEDGQWVDVTTYIDKENHIIYGEVYNLSPFLIAEDTGPPVLSGVPIDVSVDCDQGLPTIPAVTATDNVDASVNVEYSEAKSDETCVNRYTLTRTWTATDESGNSVSESQIITVSDDIAPVIKGVPVDPFVVLNDPGQGGAIVNYPAISATDNCGGVSVISFDRPSGSLFEVGSHTVNITAVDECTNSSAASLIVTVVDNEPPVITPPGLISRPNDLGECFATVTLVNPMVSDNCGVASITHDAPAEFPIGRTAVTWTATDIHGNQSEEYSIVEVKNIAPDRPVITAPIDPIPINSSIDVSATINDNNLQSATWDWGDGSFSDVTIINGDPLTEIFGQHTYSETGVYSVTLIVDECGSTTVDSIFQYVVVYDPSAGFVTGGGWIDSPLGASVLYPEASGKANFGFVSKYKKGTTVPTGNTEFQFKAGDLNFNSYVYDWLVIAGSRAMFKGEGTINGAGQFGFMISAVDVDLRPNGVDDMFRIKIWDVLDGDAVVYDNELGADEDAEPTTAIGGGSIVIHTKDDLKGAAIIDPEAKINIYPNPFDNSIYIDLYSENTHDIIIDMIDMNGRIIDHMFKGIVTENVEHNFELNTSIDLIPGYYMLRITTADGRILAREMILKQ